MSALFSKIGALFIGLGMLLGAHAPAVAPSFGATAFTPVGGQTYTLAGAGITSSANTITLSSFTTPDGRALTMSMFGSIGYGVLEPNSPTKLEDITFTGITQNTNGTAVLTGVSRGMDFVSPYASTVSLQKSHAGGAYFILSNSAGFYGQQFLFANNPGTSTAILTFSSTTPPQYDLDNSTMWSTATGTTLVDLYKLNATAFGGGTVSVSSGGTGQVTLPQSALLIGNGTSPVTGTSSPTVGYLAATSTTATSTFAGQITVSGISTSTFSGNLAETGITALAGSSLTTHPVIINGIPYAFPASQGAASSYLGNDGSGNLSWGILAANHLLASSTSVTGSASASSTQVSFSVPANTLATGNIIHIHLNGVSISILNAEWMDYEFGYGVATTSLDLPNGTAGAVPAMGYMDIYVYETGVTNAQHVLIQIFAAGSGVSSTAAFVSSNNSASIATDDTQTKQMVLISKGKSGSDSVSYDSWYAEIIR